MSERMSLEEIERFWAAQAAEHGTAPDASWSDVRVMEMEVRELLARIQDGERVLDVGCANGFSTIALASQRRVHVRGLDYIPAMIDAARAATAALPADLPGTVEFDVGNILSLEEPADTYDTVVVVRVVINLGEWENQAKALAECARVVKPGGLLLLSEATLGGWRRLNALRCEWGLDPIPMPGFNSYVDEEQVAEALAASMDLLDIVNFASSYYVGTRVLKPLLAKVADAGVDVANPRAEWNRWCSELPAAGDYGTQKLFVFRKR